MKGSGRGLVEETVSFAWKTDITNYNKNGNVRITKHCGAFSLSFLLWKSSKYYIF